MRRLIEAPSRFHMIGMNAGLWNIMVGLGMLGYRGLILLAGSVLDAFENLYFSVALAPLFAIVLEAVPVDHCG